LIESNRKTNGGQKKKERKGKDNRKKGP
jgi:hypothetical protein